MLNFPVEPRRRSWLWRAFKKAGDKESAARMLPDLLLSWVFLNEPIQASLSNSVSCSAERLVPSAPNSVGLQDP